jgi:hypothetical protein
VFRGARLVLWFDVVMIGIGLSLLLNNWTLLTGSNVVATVIEAFPQCTYSKYVSEEVMRSRRTFSRLPRISGTCVEKEAQAKQLIKDGYDLVSKEWKVIATINGRKKPIEFYKHDGNELVYKESWKGFLWDRPALVAGSKINVLRSFSGDSHTPLREPQKIGDKMLAFYKVLIGLVLFFGTLAIHFVPYWHVQNRKSY